MGEMADFLTEENEDSICEWCGMPGIEGCIPECETLVMKELK